jgi:holo-[acyl-carrier protein] synthase
VVLELPVAVIGLGIDVVDIARAEAMLAPHRIRVLERLLTAAERDYVLAMRHPARHLAVRLAAKEAVYKALQSLPGARDVGWREIEVERDVQGRPRIRLHGKGAALVAGHGETRIHVSLSHSDQSAVAAAVLEGHPA